MCRQSMDPELVASQYAKIRAAFAAHGCDWVILSPHYVRPGPVEGWMGHGFNQVISAFQPSEWSCVRVGTTNMTVITGKRSQN